MEERQEQLLIYIIEEYVRSKEPVGSKLLAEKYQLDVSPATIRNDMAILEDEGYISQPHISAGRVPTEQAYHLWLEHTEIPELGKKECDAYEKSWSGPGADSLKTLAKTLADYADNAVVVALSPYEFYYTGLSALFSQPEFEEQGYAVSMARIIDHLDTTLGRLVQKIDSRTVLLGKDNPFGKTCGFVGTKMFHKQQKGCMGILGPLRMDYPQNISRLQTIEKIINA